LATVRIIRTSGLESPDLLPGRIQELAGQGIQVRYDPLPLDGSWPFVAASAALRAEALAAALAESGTSAVLCARGGYGASDLLDLLPWERLRGLSPKLLIGYSDVSALHSALFARLGWPCLHAPMPATSYWGEAGEQRDIDALVQILSGGDLAGTIRLKGSFPQADVPIEGWLFGGCFSVLTNMLGTGYFPQSLSGAILFFEDLGENPPRLMRFLNQWRQSGALSGVKAIVVGCLVKCGGPDDETQSLVAKQMAERTNLPVFTSSDFGHLSPNFPLGIGASARIEQGGLSWRMGQALNEGAF